MVSININVHKAKISKQTNKPDKTLFIISLALVIAGLIAVADASAPIGIRDFSDRFYFVKQQIVWAGIGVLLMIIFMNVKYTIWEKLATPLFFASIVLLFLVLIPGIGTKTLGARRWIILGPMSIQPSEIVKMTLALYLAKLASKDKELLSYVIPLGITTGLIMLQPDLGTTMVVAAIGMVQIFITGVNLFKFMSLLGVGTVGAFLLILTSDYRKDRLMTFISQSQDPLGKSYHIRQILLSLGLGGMFGVGLGESRQKYLFLPEAATDSIFAVIAEEIGFLGSMVIIILLASYIIKSAKIAAWAPDRFSMVLAIGLTAWIGSQIFFNIGSMLAIVPLTGIPLPFFSYGGTALSMVLFATGILLNISKYSLTKNDKQRK